MSNVYVYDITAEDIYSEEDFGFIASSPSVSEDYQQISSASATSEDWFAITSTFTQIPFGSIGNISGTAEERSSNKFDASGTIQVSKTLDENVTFTWAGTGTLFEIGNGLERSLSPYVSSGTVRIEGDNTLVSFSANPPEDTQLFSFSGTGIEKDVDSYVGIGTATIYGIPLVYPEVDYTPHYGIDQNIGIGTTGIQISGGATPKSINSWVGLGTFSALSGAAESITKVYDDYDSIIIEYDDWGLLTETPPYNGFFDWGLVSIPNDGGEAWGPIVGYGSSTLYPFGLFNISGAAIQSATIGNYSGRGNINIIGIGSETIQYQTIKVYGTDFVTGWVDTGILSPNFTDQWKLRCNATGFGGPSNGTYRVVDNYVVTYAANASSIVALNYWISNAVVGSRDYVNFDIGPASKWSSGYVVSTTTPITSFSQLTEDYSYATFSIGGEVGFVFRLPDYVQETSGTLGNINLLNASIKLSGNLVHPNIDYTPHYGIEKNIGIGTTGIRISGTGLDAYSAQTPENTQLFTFSGNGIEKDVDSYVGIGTLLLSGTIVEKNTESYVGLGTATVFGTALESYSANTPDNTQLFSFSGTGLEAYSAQTPEDTQLFSFSGELLHPDIDYTPHYGIDRNIGVGTTGIQLSGFTRNYSNRYPGPGGGLPDNAGIGTFRFDQTNNTAKYGVLTPYAGSGLFEFLGTAYESFSITTYNGSGQLNILGIASTKRIKLYQYSGDGQDPIVISEQTNPITEKVVYAYSGSGIVTISENLYFTKTNSYNGSGSISNLSGASESLSAQTPENTILYAVSGSASESFIAQTPETEVLYTFDGTLVERKTNSYGGTGTLSITGTATAKESPNPPASGVFRFVSHTVDHSYDTCDSEEFTCDYQDSAFIKFIANPPENTILFNFYGSAQTEERSIYTYGGSGFENFYGTYTNLKRSYAESGIGTIFAFTSGIEKDIDSYVGSGSLFAVSGGSQSYSAQTPEGTILLQISGSATTRIESEYLYVGIGNIAISGSATTREFAVYPTSSGGTITISGELIHPNIKFIPAPSGSGTLVIVGDSNNSLTKRYTQTSGTLFGLSSGLESYSRTPYIGVGTMYISDSYAITIDNPYQIPRTYVSII